MAGPYLSPVPDDLALLLLPRPLESFILRDQAQDLLAAPGVVAADPRAVPYGASLRLPHVMADVVARRRPAPRAVAARRGRPRVIVIFHPVQYPLARALLDAGGREDTELWYWRWDRFEHAYDASPAAARGSRPARGGRGAGDADDRRLRRARASSSARRGAQASSSRSPPTSFPRARPRAATVVAVSLGHLGWRTDWALLRAVAERMPELVLLLVGAWHDDEATGDADYAGLPRGARTSSGSAGARRARPPRADPLRGRRDRAVQGRAVQRRRAAVPDPQVRPPRPPDGRAADSRACARGSAR